MSAIMKDNLGMPGAVATIDRGRPAAPILRRPPVRHLLVALAALAGIAIAVWHLQAATDGLSIQADSGRQHSADRVPPRRRRAARRWW